MAWTQGKLFWFLICVLVFTLQPFEITVKEQDLQRVLGQQQTQMA